MHAHCPSKSHRPGRHKFNCHCFQSSDTCLSHKQDLLLIKLALLKDEQCPDVTHLFLLLHLVTHSVLEPIPQWSILNESPWNWEGSVWLCQPKACFMAAIGRWQTPEHTLWWMNMGKLVFQYVRRTFQPHLVLKWNDYIDFYQTYRCPDEKNQTKSEECEMAMYTAFVQSNLDGCSTIFHHCRLRNAKNLESIKNTSFIMYVIIFSPMK